MCCAADCVIAAGPELAGEFNNKTGPKLPQERALLLLVSVHVRFTTVASSPSQFRDHPQGDRVPPSTDNVLGFLLHAPYSCSVMHNASYSHGGFSPWPRVVLNCRFFANPRLTRWTGISSRPSNETAPSTSTILASSFLRRRMYGIPYRS